MDPTSIAPLVASAWTILEPYVPIIATKAAEEIGKKAPEAVGNLWNAIKDKMESKLDVASLSADLAKSPEDEDTQAAFRYQLKKLLENDAAFTKQLEELVEEAKHGIVTNMNANLDGSGAIAQGENARAVGEGGVMIEGDMKGNIATGDNNTISNDP